jgi:O-antigen ligase
VQLPLSRPRQPIGILAQLSLAALAAYAILAAPFPMNLALFPALAVGLLALLAPVLLPILLVFSVPAQDVVSFSAGPASLTATRGMVLLSISIVGVLLASGTIRPRGSILMAAFALYISVMVLSLSRAHDFGVGFGEIYRWAVALLVLWLVIQFVRTRNHALAVLLIAAISAGVLGAIGAAQTVLGVGPASFAITGGLTRAFGTFGMPNSYAAYLEMSALPLLPVALWALARTWTNLRVYQRERLAGVSASLDRRRQVIAYAAMCAIFAGGFLGGLAGIIVSFSRGGWLATAGALAIMAAFLGRRLAIAVGVGAFVLVVAISGNLHQMAPEAIQLRYGQIRDQLTIFDASSMTLTAENFAAVERMAHWQTGLAMWESAPLLGIGAGNFDARYREFAVHPTLIHSRGHAHNYFIHALAETGIAGLLAYLTLLGTAVAISIRAWRSPDSLARAIGVGALGMTAALMLHGLVENLHVLNISVQIAAVWGLAAVASTWVAADEREATRKYGPGPRRAGTSPTMPARSD